MDFGIRASELRWVLSEKSMINLLLEDPTESAWMQWSHRKGSDLVQVRLVETAIDPDTLREEELSDPLPREEESLEYDLYHPNPRDEGGPDF